MYKNVLQSIEGISIYPIVSLVIFVLFFAIMIIWLVKADKNYIRRMSNLPLESTSADENKFTGENNE